MNNDKPSSESQQTKREPWGFCETPEEKCTMNYCDDNGCINRKRNLVSSHIPTEQPGDAKHTPGQWKVDITFKKNGYYCTSLCSGDDGIIRPAIAE